jgi:ferredoxin/flavodoxin
MNESPRCAIIHFSLTGNTLLACQYLSHRIPMVDFDLLDARESDVSNLAGYETIGFSTYCDFQGPPKMMIDTIDSLPEGEGKPAFILITFAAVHGHTLKELKKIIEKKGYRVISGFALRMPESYSPLRKKGMLGDDKPDSKDLDSYQHYIRSLSDDLVAHHLGKKIEYKKIKIGLFNSFFRGKDRYKAGKKMGKKTADAGLCTKCGLCERSCSYDAIELSPTPRFNEERCMGCFSCYNHCPVGAISTEKLSADFSYPGPSEELRKKMSY